MNRREFEEHLRAQGCEIRRHGAKHDMWWHPGNRRKAAVPRHRTIKKPLARGICRKLVLPLPPGL
ncbi:MAG TPA: type II toxin-antitoxin system HicA family toxin [Fimbriiglobus sp.]|nr:type II toxin-antitoxin system HicA family toxin [Fimbriiglobus sp.]